MINGDLYRVIVNKHTNRQLGDLVLIIRQMGDFVEGLNLITNNRHHYLKDNLEKL